MTKALPIARVRCRPIAECKEPLKKERTTRVKRPKTFNVPKRMHRRTNASQRLLVVRLRYGDTPFTRIAELTGIHRNTCVGIVDSFFLRKTFVPAKPAGRPTLPIPSDVEDYLQNQLHDARFLSLRDRLKVIREKFNFPMSYKRLWNYFRLNQIRYTTPGCVYKAAKRGLAARTTERRLFAQQFMSLVLQKKKVYIIDETSVSDL